MTSLKKNVLLVDNSPLILQRLVQLIGNLPGVHRVCEAHSFESAVSLLESEQVDIAILDLHLDGKSGIDLLPYITKRYPHIVIIMLTNHAHESYEALSKKLGATYFLDKSKDFERIPHIMSSLA